MKTDKIKETQSISIKIHINWNQKHNGYALSCEKIGENKSFKKK